MSDLILTVGLDTQPAQQQLKKTLAEIKDAIEKAAAKSPKAKADTSAIDEAKRNADALRKIQLNSALMTGRAVEAANRASNAERAKENARARQIELNSAKMTGAAALAEVKRQNTEKVKETARARQIELNSAKMTGAAALAEVKRQNTEKAKEAARARQIELNSAKMAGAAALAENRAAAKIVAREKALERAKALKELKDWTRQQEAEAKRALQIQLNSAKMAGNAALAETKRLASEKAKEAARALQIELNSAKMATAAAAAANSDKKATIRTVGGVDNRAAGFEMRIDRQLGNDPTRQAALVAKVRSAVADYKNTVSQFGVASTEAARAHVKLQGSFQAVNGEIAKHGGLLKNLNDGFSGLAVGGQNLTRFLMNTQVALSALAGAFGFRQILDANLEIQKFTNTLRATADSTAEFVGNMDFLKRKADEVGVSITSVGNPFSRFTLAAKAAGFGTTEVKDAFEQLIGASRNFGLSAADTQGVIRALEQSLSKGKFMAEEVRGQLGDRLPVALQALQRATGKTSAELNKMFEAGSISTEKYFIPFVKALFDMSGGQEALSRSSVSLQAQLDRMSNAFLFAAEAAGEGGFNAAVERAAKGMADFLNSTAGQNTFKAFGATIDLVSRSISVLIGNLDKVGIAFGLLALTQIGSAANAVKLLTTAFSGLTAAMVANPFTALAVGIGLAAVGIASMTDGLTNAERATKMLSGTSDTLRKADEASLRTLGDVNTLRKATAAEMSRGINVNSAYAKSLLDIGVSAKQVADKLMLAGVTEMTKSLKEATKQLADAQKEITATSTNIRADLSATSFKLGRQTSPEDAADRKATLDFIREAQSIMSDPKLVQNAANIQKAFKSFLESNPGGKSEDMVRGWAESIIAIDKMGTSATSTAQGVGVLTARRDALLKGNVELVNQFDDINNVLTGLQANSGLDKIAKDAGLGQVNVAQLRDRLIEALKNGNLSPVTEEIKRLADAAATAGQAVQTITSGLDAKKFDPVVAKLLQARAAMGGTKAEALDFKLEMQGASEAQRGYAVSLQAQNDALKSYEKLLKAGKTAEAEKIAMTQLGLVDAEATAVRRLTIMQTEEANREKLNKGLLTEAAFRTLADTAGDEAATKARLEGIERMAAAFANLKEITVSTATTTRTAAEKTADAFANMQAKLMQAVDTYADADAAAENFYEGMNMGGRKLTASMIEQLAGIKNLGNAIKELDKARSSLDSATQSVEVQGIEGDLKNIIKLGDAMSDYSIRLIEVEDSAKMAGLSQERLGQINAKVSQDMASLATSSQRYIDGLGLLSQTRDADIKQRRLQTELDAIEFANADDAATQIALKTNAYDSETIALERKIEMDGFAIAKSRLATEEDVLRAGAITKVTQARLDQIAAERGAINVAEKASGRYFDAKQTQQDAVNNRRIIEAELKGPTGQAFKEFYDDVNEGFTDAFASAFSGTNDGFKDLMKSMKDTFAKMLAAMAFEAAIKPVIIPVMQQVGTQVFGLSGDATSKITGAPVGGSSSGGPGIMDLAQNGMSLASNSGMFSSAAASANAWGASSGLFGNGVAVTTGTNGMLTGGGAASSGAVSTSGALGSGTLTSTLGAGAGVAAGGFLAGSLVGGYFGNKTQSKAVGGLSGAASGAVAGAVIGSFVPVIGTAIGAIIGGIAGALGGILGTAGKPSNKEGNATYDLAKRKVTAIGGQTGKKFSQENRDAASAAANDVGVLGQALELVSGKKLASQIKVTVGSRDGLIAETNGQSGKFKADEEGWNGLVKFFVSSFTDQLGETLPKDVRTALGHIDFKDMEKALGDIEFAAGFQDQLKSLRAEFGLTDSVTADAKAQVSALVTSIADFKGKTAALGLDINAAADATKNFVDAFINGRDQKTYTEVEAAVATVNARFAAMTPLLKEVGYSAGEAAIVIQNGLNKALDTLRVNFVAGLDAQLNDLTGKGYINSISGLVEQFGLAQRDAAALGVGMDKVNQIFQLSAQGIVNEAGISGAALDELMGLFPQLAGKLVGATADAAAEAENALKTLQTRQQMEIKLLGLMKKDTAALALSRQVEMEAMNSSLRPLQAQIYAMEDLAAAEDKVATARQNAVDAIDREITKQNEAADAARSRMDSYGSLASGLKDYRTSLLMGELSPLTADQQYNEARNAFAETATKAQGGDISAIEQLQGTSQSFLELSRTLFASSDAYYKDFELVQTALLSTESLTSRQFDLAKSQLDGITATVAGLEAQKLAISAVEAAVLTIPEAIRQLDLSLQAMYLAQTQADAIVGAGPAVPAGVIAQYVPSASGGGDASVAPAVQQVAVAVVQGNAANEQMLAELAKQMAAMSDAIVEQQDALNRLVNKR